MTEMKQNHLFEWKRQLAHIVFGILILWGLHFDILSPLLLGLITLIIGVLLFSISKGFIIPVFSPVLLFFERKDDIKKCPGCGLFFFLLSSFLCVLFFEKWITMASLAILVIGDSVTTLIGIHFGKIKNPLNKKKSIEGTLAGMISSFFVCLLFFPLLPSAVTAFVAMMVEIPRFYINEVPVDDNLTIPLSAGLVLYLFSL
ncbi:hypothetical protein HON22_05160 [Candidatus Peregrinibacteria bacterium]|jgi:phytol kinase|nr:hypothetical protein [Candidatus Peregrinibacteria bacterium]